jgi:hypothetical protein
MVGAMGLGLRLAVWPSMAKRLTVLWISWMLLLAPIGGCWANRNTLGDAPLLAMSAILLAIGAALIHWARKSWLNLELG